ncbi:MAG: aminotransferase V, partial [Acidobacteria bacterium]|nr:aminotransferase V [Acidobacteriota bacterium]
KGARKFESLGQRDDAALAAVGTTVAFHDRLGMKKIEARVVELATMLKSGLTDAGFELVTPLDPALSGGVAIAAVDSARRGALVDALYERYGIACAATGGLRICPHVYNTAEHVARAVSGARALREEHL